MEDYKISDGEEGLMFNFSGSQNIKDKVLKYHFGLQEIDRVLYGTIEIELKAGEKLTREELEELITKAKGQASDGFGEGFEQQAIKYDKTAFSVSLWKSNHDFNARKIEEL